MIEWKQVAKVEARRRPGIGGVTGLAVRAKGAAMVNGIGMTTHTISRRTLEDIVGMTFGAGRVDVRASQGKGRLAVIEGCLLPIRWCVAASAVRAELPLVFVVLEVTGDTILGRALVHLIHVTRLALRCRVLAEQWKGRLVVVYLGILPVGQVVAGRAIVAELTLMTVILQVTARARLGGRLE